MFIQTGQICYESAREFFAAVRDAMSECDRSRYQLQKLYSQATRISGGIVCANGQNGSANAEERIDNYLDVQAMLEKRIAEDEALADLADQLLYGITRGSGGLAELLGTDYADLMWLRFVAHDSWEGAAHAAGWSRRVARQRAEEAFDLMDALGAASVIAGTGVATD